MAMQTGHQWKSLWRLDASLLDLRVTKPVVCGTCVANEHPPSLGSLMVAAVWEQDAQLAPMMQSAMLEVGMQVLLVHWVASWAIQQTLGSGWPHGPP